MRQPWPTSCSTIVASFVACPTCGQKNRLAYHRLEGARCDAARARRDAPPACRSNRTAGDFDRLSSRVRRCRWWSTTGRRGAARAGWSRRNWQKVAARQAGSLLVVKVNTDELSDLGSAFRHPLDPDDGRFRGRPGSRGTGRAPGRRHRGVGVEQATPGTLASATHASKGTHQSGSTDARIISAGARRPAQTERVRPLIILPHAYIDGSYALSPASLRRDLHRVCAA